MGVFSGLFAKREKSIGPIFLDVFVREFHKRTIALTEFPVEFGVTINDHRVIQPIEIEIDGAVSNSFPSIRNLSRGLSGATNVSQNRATDIYDELVNLQVTGEPVDLQTGLKTYKNMVLTSI